MKALRWPRMTKQGAGPGPRDGVKVSVVVPVYNPGPHIDDLVTSLESQTLDLDEFEVIFVDDGSTDGTGKRLDQLAKSHANFFVIHIPNSGWPGRPRNVGIDAAQGTFVFFADNDDVLAADGLRSMYEWGTRHDSDVVIGREVGLGRVVSKEVFRSSIARAELGKDPILGILTPHKMYRRAMLLENGIRFAEGVFRLEDHLFNISSFFAARTVSVFADSPCYYWTKRPDEPKAGKNASYIEWSPDVYYGTNMDAILGVVEANTDPGPERDKLYAHWFDTKMLMRLTDKRFVNYTPRRRRDMYAAIRELSLRRFDPTVDSCLTLRTRVRAALLRADRFDELVQLAASELGVGGSLEATRAGWDDATAEVEFSMQMSYKDGSAVEFEVQNGRALWITPVDLSPEIVTPEVLDATDDIAAARLDLLVKERDAAEDYFAPVEGEVRLVPTGVGERHRLVATGIGRIDMRHALAGREPQGIVDISVRLWVGGWSLVRRVPSPLSSQSPPVVARSAAQGTAVEMYTTQMGNLSFRPSAPAPTP